VAWRKAADPFPAPLRCFREEDWPPVPGEHLGHYWCCAPAPDPAPEPGEACGDRCYALLAREYPGRPEVLAAARRADAFTRYHQARLSWLGEDHPGWIEEFFDGDRHGEIRYAPFRGPGGVA
jgi:hypothetical protein